MNVLFVISEMAPLVKVGGVGDVGGSLAAALRRLGLDVRVALPAYAAIDREALGARRAVALPDGASVWQGAAGGTPVYLVADEAFDRPQVYGYEDDAERFLRFADVLLAAAGRLGWHPDVLHLHDWHSGFVACRLAGGGHNWAALPRLTTLHNVGYTGAFDRAFAEAHALPPAALESPPGLSVEAPYSALAQGVLHADIVSTVSPTYAREIIDPEYGGALALIFRRLGDRLTGVLNGIDMAAADPATDARLAATFDASTLERRIENKRALQRELGLPVDDGVPLAGMVSRLFWQKGADLAAEAVERLLASGVRLQLAVLGDGDEYEGRIRELAAAHPDAVGARIAFDLRVAQLIHGGSDLFLMPSRYEPCGLGQMFAMRYGSVPVVRRTGGLADSVQPYDAASDAGTGFLFDEATPDALAAAVRRALDVFAGRDAWQRLQRRGMAQDWSWERAARRYVETYERAGALQHAGETVGDLRG